MNTEFWTVVINGSANLMIAGASVCQLIILYCTFKVGSNFLKDHKLKSKVERELGLIYDSMKKIHELRQIWYYWCDIDEAVYNQATRKDALAYPMIEKIGADFLKKHQEKDSEWKDIRMTLRVNFKLINDPKIDQVYSDVIRSEEVAKIHYFNLRCDSNYSKYYERMAKIPPSFYSDHQSLGLNSRFEYLLKLLQEKYLKAS